MPSLHHKFESLPDIARLIPGLRFTEFGDVYGAPDALEACGVNVKHYWPQLFTDKYGHDVNLDCLDEPKLRIYQHEAVSWLYNTLTSYGGAILADDMGLGKTRTAIYAASKLPGCNSILVVCPASVVYQWQSEAKVFGLQAYILGPLSKPKLYESAWKLLQSNTNSMYITSYNLANKAFDAYPGSFDCLLLDEPHTVLRGRTGKWAWALKDNAQLCKYRIATTGTPMFNQPRDLWFILFILFNMRFGKAKVFDARYCEGKQGTYGWTNKGAANLNELKNRLSHYMLRRTTEEVAIELPPITTSFLWVDADAKAQSAMMKAGGNYGAVATDEALHACLDAKIALTVETAIEQSPCLVFTYHRHHAEEIASGIEKGGGKAYAIHGGLPVNTRHNLIKLARTNQTSIVATIDSTGTGVDGLQHVTNKGIFHTIERSPKKTHQAMKRLQRSGQKLPTHWTFIAMKDAMDEIVTDTVLRRLDYWNQLMGKDMMQDEVGQALTVTEDQEAAVLKAIYESLK